MDFRTFCDNTGCRKEVRPTADKETMIAYCPECEQPIKSISPFMIRQMVSEGQIKKVTQKKLAWSVKCPKCSKEGPPKLDKTKKKILCSFCEEEMTHLNQPFVQSLLINLKGKKED